MLKEDEIFRENYVKIRLTCPRCRKEKFLKMPMELTKHSEIGNPCLYDIECTLNFCLYDSPMGRNTVGHQVKSNSIIPVVFP